MTGSMTILDNIRIAAPCPAEWAGMLGDDRSRFCGSCEKHVYNLLAMSADEVVRLIQEQEGKLCCRLYRRADGTVLTGDCPVGVRAVWRRMKQLVMACAAAVLVCVGGVLMPSIVAGRPSSNASSPGPVVQKAQALWDDLLVWTGFRRRLAIAGDICIVPPATPAPSGNQGGDESQ